LSRYLGINDSPKIGELVQASGAPYRLDCDGDFGGFVLQKSKNAVLGLLNYSVLEDGYEANFFFELWHLFSKVHVAYNPKAIFQYRPEADCTSNDGLAL
jgi:hypothetical protein